MRTKTQFLYIRQKKKKEKNQREQTNQNLNSFNFFAALPPLLVESVCLPPLRF
jgi:hypothetical protein